MYQTNTTNLSNNDYYTLFMIFLVNKKIFNLYRLNFEQVRKTPMKEWLINKEKPHRYIRGPCIWDNILSDHKFWEEIDHEWHKFRSQNSTKIKFIIS